MHFLYEPTLSSTFALVEPSTELRRHLAALRIRSGETVTLFDGKGLRASCALEGAPSDGVLRVVTRKQADTPLPLTLALGLLDSRERYEFAVEKATELGVTQIVLLDSDHASHMRSTDTRIRAKTVAACEQSGNLWLPEVAGPISLDEFIATTKADVLVVGDQHGSQPLALGAVHCAVVVGPEGGFSEREHVLLTGDARTRLWCVGTHRLRAETAAVAMTTAVRLFASV